MVAVFFMRQVNIFLLVFCILSINCNFTYSGSGLEDSNDAEFSFFPCTSIINENEVDYHMRHWKEDREEAQTSANMVSCLCSPFTCAVDCATLPFRLIYFAGKKAVTKIQARQKGYQEYK